jgi:hypothetical protein
LADLAAIGAEMRVLIAPEGAEAQEKSPGLAAWGANAGAACRVRV